MILITGASGTVGGAVLEVTRKRDLPVKALYRTEAEARKASAGATAVVGDFADPASLRPALDGVQSLFLVCGPVPQLVQLESNVIDACVERGIGHVVLHSALGADDYPKSFPAWHRQVEDKLRSTGLRYTILRPNSFMQNILSYIAPSIRSQNAFFSCIGDARMSYIDVRDIAAVAANMLGNPDGHAGKTYELNGPEAVSNAELAGRISRAAQRHIEYVDISESAQQKAMEDLGMPAWQIAALLDLQRFYAAGQGAEITPVLADLLGRAPKTLDEFLEEFQSSFRSAAISA